MLLRISLVVAILAGIAVGVLNFVMVKKNLDTVIGQRNDQHSQLLTTTENLHKTTKELEKTTADLTRTKETLVATEQERDKAVAEAAAQQKKAADLAAKLSTTTTERDDAQAQLASYKATGYTPPQILGFDKQFKDLRETIETANVENKVLSRKVSKLQNKLDELTNPGWRPPALPAELRGKVLVCDPKWDFVLVDVGEDQGVVEKGEMLVSRNGKLVAKLSVRSVDKKTSIANVLPGWKLGEVMEGDQILPGS